jgi:large subunit ribosomal protein L18
MSKKSLKQRQARRLIRVRAKIHGMPTRPRLAVFRSLCHLNAQVIDDVAGRTLVAASDIELPAKEQKGKKAEIAAKVGQLLGERAKAKGVTFVVFDRRDKKYHGRVKALADAARAAGLIF